VPEESVLIRRKKKREAKALAKRAAKGDVALHSAKGRTAEKPGAAGGRTRYGGTPGVEHPAKIIKGKAAKHTVGQIGPKEQYLFPVKKK
jgi:hypothetical protein